MSPVPHSERRLLTLNAGSSSLKFAVFVAERTPRRILSGKIGGIGRAAAELVVRTEDGGQRDSQRVAASDHASALREIWRWLEQHDELGDLVAVGHRIVHGGPDLFDPQLVTPPLLGRLRELVPFAPEHLPPELALIEAVGQHPRDLPQVVCFDTAFHRDLPATARRLPVPRRFAERGVRRFGFHGLSYQFLLQELARLAPRVASEGRVILAHLGNGASLAAVHEGRCIDTSMGFTPAGGIPMSTRTGDLDPGALAFMVEAERMSPARLRELLNTESGLAALSGSSGDLRELVGRTATDERAAEAVAYFCYHVKKCIGAYAAALGGVDALVFAGGVGENLAVIRAGVCAGLEFLGLELDHAANRSHAPIISAEHSRVSVRVIRTDEEQIIARATCRVLEHSPSRHETGPRA